MKAIHPNSLWLILIVIFFGLPIPVLGAVNPNILITLEEPANASTISGVSSIRGFAVGPARIVSIQSTIDNRPTEVLTFGGTRPDVERAFPTNPNARNSGFARAINFSGLTAGSHTITILATDVNGDTNQVTSTFNVVRFDNPFIADLQAFSLTEATGTLAERAITLQNVTADGQRYDVLLEWRPAIQGFAITRIQSSGGGGESARWAAVNALCCPSGTHTYSVTIDGVTKRSINNSCDPDDPTLTDSPATATPGLKNFTASVSAPACNAVPPASGTETFVAGRCYAFVLDLDDAGNTVTLHGEVDCSLLPSATQASDVTEDAWSPRNIPTGNFKLLPMNGSDGNSLEMLKKP